MWLISGPFDGNASGEIDFTKTKLLKSGRSYTIGRRLKSPSQLVVNHPKVSAEHAVFTVGESSESDVPDPSKKPRLTFFDKRGKATAVVRGDEAFAFEKGKEVKLLDGDKVLLITGLYVTVQWRTVCCLSPRSSKAFSLEACAPLGIKVIAEPDVSVTHHLTSTLSLTHSIATSMLCAAQLVKPEWLTEFIRLGTELTNDSVPESPSKLEYEFSPPPETKFRPSFAPTLPKALKTFKTWEANDERVGMFRSWRFVFLIEQGGEIDGEVKVLVDRGGASRDVFDVSGGPARFRSMFTAIKLKFSKDGKGMAIVADVDKLKDLVGDSWSGLEDVLRNFGLRITNPSEVIEAVVHVDPSRINVSTTSENDDQPSAAMSSLPDFVPNTHLHEPSNIPDSVPAAAMEELTLAGPSRRRPTRMTRSTSRAPSQPPVEPSPVTASSEVEPNETNGDKPEEQEVTAPRRRRNLVRRANTNVNALVGVDDPSIIFDSQSVSSGTMTVDSGAAEPNSPPPMPAPTQGGRVSRLKRRAGAIEMVNPLLAEMQKAMESDDTGSTQPALKKFKALFDETDPGRDPSQTQFPESFGIGSSLGFSGDIVDSRATTSIQSQEETDQGRGASQVTGRSRLGAIAEEEENQKSAAVNATRGKKRALGAIEEEIAETQASKRPAIEGMNGIRPSTQLNMTSLQVPRTSTQKPPSTTQRSRKHDTASGAQPGKPDQDAAFLKALASQKRGKRTEDITDREFNNLRISKPDIQEEEEVKEWAVLDEFARDEDLRGNFMVIVEMDVPERERRVLRRAGGRMDWEGRPDFKKFKHKRILQGNMPTVELVLDEGNDYGMGSGYWKGTSQLESQNQSQADMSYVQPSQAQNQVIQIQSRTKAIVQRPASTSKPRKQTQKTQQTPKGKGHGLKIINSDEEEEEMVPVVSQRTKKGGATQTQMQKSTRAIRGKSQALFLESEDDEIENDGGGDNNSVRETVDQLEDVSAVKTEDGMDLDEDLPATLQSETSERRTRSAKPTSSNRKRPPAMVVDDDSDTGMAFKGFRGKKRGRGK